MEQDLIMQGLAKALSPFLVGSKAVSGTPSTPYVHGPGGLFGVAGLSRDIISTRVQPQGLASELAAQGSLETDPLYPYLTGFLSPTGSEKSAVCDDPQTAGSLKTCIQTAQFGRKEFQTRVSEVNRIGQRTNRGEFMDLTLLNDPLVADMAGLLRQQFGLSGQAAALGGADMLMRFIEVGVGFQNWLCPTLYTGNPANNTAGGGYEEFPGLDILIGTTKVDALSGQACPSLRSLVVNHNYSMVTDAAAPNNIVNTLTYVTRNLKHNASKMNFGRTEWTLAMREELFYEITAVWPCNYMTYRCIFPNSEGVLNVSATDAIAMRDSMRQGNYLVIDGMRWNVTLDDCIAEQNEGDAAPLSAGQFASDIYIIPLTVRGGTRVTYWEYFDYSKSSIPAINQGRLSSFYWSDGGRFLWHAKPPTNWCVQHIAKIEPRVVVLTPQLAARITNVAYNPLIHTRDPLPTQDYFVNGGVSGERPAPSHFSDWNAG